MPIKIYGGGPNPPVRLDKWQNIVGVGWPDDDDARYYCLVYSLFLNFDEFETGYPDCIIQADETDSVRQSEVEPNTPRCIESVTYGTFYDFAFTRDTETGTWSDAGSFPFFEDLSLEFQQHVLNFSFGSNGLARGFVSNLNGTQAVTSPFPRWEPAAEGGRPSIDLPNPFGMFDDIDGIDEMVFDQSTLPGFFAKGNLMLSGFECWNILNDEDEPTGSRFMFGYAEGESGLGSDAGGQNPLREPIALLAGSERALDFTGARIEVGFDTYEAVATKVAGHDQLVRPDGEFSNRLQQGFLFVLFREVKESD